jgi:hypothetical protein
VDLLKLQKAPKKIAHANATAIMTPLHVATTIADHAAIQTTQNMAQYLKLAYGLKLAYTSNKV